VDEPWLIEQLVHADEHIRTWAVRLLVDRGDVSAAAVAALQDLATREKSGLVQVYLASAMQRLAAAERWPIAEALAAHDEFANDRELPLMVWYGIEPALVQQPERAVKLALASRLPIVRQNIARRLTVEIERLPGAVDALVARLAESAAPAVQADLLTGMSQALRGWRKAPVPAAWSGAAAKLAASAYERVQTLTRELAVVFGDGRALDDLQAIVMNGGADSELRRQALRTLIDSRVDNLGLLLPKLIGDRVLANDVVRGLAACDEPQTPRLVLDNYPRLDPEGRGIAITTLVSRPTWAKALLNAVSSGLIARGDLSAFHARQIRSFEDEALNARLGEVWGETRATDAQKRTLIERYKGTLTSERLAGANLPAGRALFAKSCANCHVLYGQGKTVGPDLTGSNRRNLDYLLENIVDPSASVAVDFRMSVAVLASGRVVNGLIVEKADRTLTFQTQNERVVVERSEIEEQRGTALSLMPDGLLQTLGDDQVRDLVGYLMSTEQVPLPANAGNAAAAAR